MPNSHQIPIEPPLSNDRTRAPSHADLLHRLTTLPGPRSELDPSFRDDNCSLAIANDERARFEVLLMQLSATFINVPASAVDSTIESALRQIVEILGIDRSGLGEMSADRTELLITHSYQVPGVPPSPRVLVDERFPWYAKMIRQGEVIRLERLPDDLPCDAVPERMYCAQAGFKSNLAIPLKVMGSVVGGIGFGSFRRYREWPSELVQRLSLIGDIFTNALARKQADEALQRATEQARLLRDELAHATRLELVNHLTASIAHEVNQPLCAIASNAQTAIDLLDMGNVEEARGALTDIWGDAKRASDVIGRIRGMVRKEEPRRTDISLASIIEELAPVLLREAEAKGVTLRTHLESRGPSVFCDRVQLQQVVMNLVLNAVEAARNSQHVDPPAVCVRVEVENNDWVHVAVEDTGAGLSQGDCERVFAPFFTTKAKGLGMGLGISRTIVAAHGGRVWATPGAKLGTVFHVRLPIASGSRDGT
jgi:signal transduction histidine kinase